MAKQARPKSSADRDPGVNADWRWLIAGGVAGSVAKTCTAPLSRVTILLQVKGIDLPNGASSGASLRNRIPLETLPALRALVREEGFASLWRGNGTSVVHRFPYSAINFWTFETAKRWLVLARSGRSEGEGSERLRPKATPGDRFIAGAIAAATAVTLCYPLDLVRTRLAAQSPEDKSKYRGMFHALSRIWRHGGFLVGFRDVVDLLLNSWHPSNKLPFPCRMSRGLFSGLHATLQCQVPSLAVSYCAYETAKEKWMVWEGGNGARERAHMSALGTIACGATSGLASSLVTFPLDVVRRRIQAQGAILEAQAEAEAAAATSMQLSGAHGSDGVRVGGGGSKCSGVGTARQVALRATDSSLSMARSIYTKHGFGGFYRGIVPELVKVVPGVAITFSVYEALKRVIGARSGI